MDNLAKVFWMQYSHSEPVFYPLSDEGFQVWLGTRKLSSHQPSVFFDHIHGKTILHWHSSHHRFPACYARRIDWDACAAALSRLPLGRRRWVSKHTSRFCAIGTMLVRWKEQPTPDCPRCTLPENSRHVWQCQELAVFFVCALLMSSLSNWMQKVHTAKDIVFWIIQRLTEWRTSEPFSPAQSDMPGLLQAISAQDRIGWLAFFKGCIAIEWAGVPEAHFLWLGRRNTGKCQVVGSRLGPVGSPEPSQEAPGDGSGCCSSGVSHPCHQLGIRLRSQRSASTGLAPLQSSSLVHSCEFAALPRSLASSGANRSLTER
jgi:hypothetical protein